MFASHLIAQSHGIQSQGEHQCCICGAPAGKDRKESLKPTFTNMDALLYPLSEYICAACDFCLSPLTRRASFLCTKKVFTAIKREDLSKFLFSPPRVPFIFCVTTSFKKYLWIYSKVNANPDMFHIRFDDMDIWCEPRKHRRVFQATEILYQSFSKKEIRTGGYRLINLEKLETLSTFERLEAEIKHWRGSAIFELCLHAANLLNDYNFPHFGQPLLNNAQNGENKKENEERWKKKKETKDSVSPKNSAQLNLC